MSLINLLTALMSIVSGLMGYKYAVSESPSETKQYVLALMFGGFAQMCLSAAVANRKDRYLHLQASPKTQNIRTALATLIASLISISSLVFAIIARTQSFLLICLAFIGCSLCFQYSTYGASTRAHVLDPAVFWKTQFYGVTGRAAVILVTVILFRGAFYGILAANLIAAIIVCFRYRSWPNFGRKVRRRLRRAVTGLHVMRLWTIDGLLRAAKNQFETTATSLTVVAFESSHLLTGAALTTAYISVGYINALTTSLRQIFARWELRRYKSSSFKAIALITSMTGAIVGAATYRLIPVLHFLLPKTSRWMQWRIVLSLSVTLAIYPLSRGFLYADYAPDSSIKRFWKSLIIGYLMAVCGVGLLLFVFAHSAISYIWCAPVPLGVAFAMRGYRARRD